MKKLIMLFLIIIILPCLDNARATNGHPWYHTFKEIKQLYDKHYNRESRLENYIYIENNRYIGTLIRDDKKIYFNIPNHFVYSMLNHLKTGLENGWFNYIFWADLNHGHLFIPDGLKKNYFKFENHKKYFEKILKDKRLGILYHSAEHFCILDPENTKYIRTRNIVGWFNEKPIEIIFPEPDASKGRAEADTASVPNGYDNVWWIGVSASKNGEFAIKVNGEIVRLDVSFEVPSIYDSTTKEERTLTGE